MRHLLWAIVAASLLLGGCGAQASDGQPIADSLGVVVAEMRAWSTNQPHSTWTEANPDEFVAGMAYGYCITIEESGLSVLGDRILNRAGGNRTLEKEWMYLLNLTLIYVCPVESMDGEEFGVGMSSI